MRERGWIGSGFTLQPKPWESSAPQLFPAADSCAVQPAGAGVASLAVTNSSRRGGPSAGSPGAVSLRVGRQVGRQGHVPRGWWPGCWRGRAGVPCGSWSSPAPCEGCWKRSFPLGNLEPGVRFCPQIPGG